MRAGLGLTQPRANLRLPDTTSLIFLVYFVLFVIFVLFVPFVGSLCVMLRDPGSPCIFAIIPAAGRSRRMGRAKQLVAVGERPMLLDVVDSLRASRVTTITLVTRAAITDALGLQTVSDARLRVVFSEDPRAEMIDSIRIALREIQLRNSPKGLQPPDGILVCPGDHPGIITADHDRCIDAFREAPDRIIIATRDGRRGHPVVFPAAMIDFVLSAACDAGLRGLPRRHPERVTEIPCSSPGVTRDIDTPDDLRRL